MPPKRKGGPRSFGPREICKGIKIEMALVQMEAKKIEHGTILTHRATKQTWTYSTRPLWWKLAMENQHSFGHQAGSVVKQQKI
jgi:hypothetical protein